MPIQSPMLYNRALIIAKVEASARVDQIAADTVAALKTTHAFLVEAPNIEPDVQFLQRQNVRVDLSPDPARAGRRLGRISFVHEVRGSGSPATAPRLGQLLRACGMAEVQRTAAANTTVAFDNIMQITQVSGSTARLAGAAGDDYTGSVHRSVTLTCTTGGGTGVAVVTVNIKARDGTNHYNTAGVTITNGTPVALAGAGDGTPTFTPTLTGQMAAGDVWQIDLVPVGFYYNPVSGSFETLSLYCYYGSGSRTILHKLIGCMGTFSVQGQAGQYGKFNFQFTGDWTTPTDVTMPTGIDYGDVVPPVCELADIYVAARGGSSPFIPSSGLLCDSFSVDIANRISLRSSIGDASGYVGSFIGGRAPVARLDPEVVLEAEHAFWGALEAATLKQMYCRVGSVAGNRVAFYGPNVQYAGMGYQDRESLRAYDLTLNLARSNGNDELMIGFD